MMLGLGIYSASTAYPLTGFPSFYILFRLWTWVRGQGFDETLFIAQPPALPVSLRALV